MPEMGGVCLCCTSMSHWAWNPHWDLARMARAAPNLSFKRWPDPPPLTIAVDYTRFIPLEDHVIMSKQQEPGKPENAQNAAHVSAEPDSAAQVAPLSPTPRTTSAPLWAPDALEVDSVPAEVRQAAAELIQPVLVNGFPRGTVPKDYGRREIERRTTESQKDAQAKN